MVGSTGKVHNELCRYKDKGNPMPLAIIENIPVSSRLPALAVSYGTDKIAAVVAKAITKTLSNFNLRVGMNAEQVLELAYQLIDSSAEDQLAFEDIMLFLDGMIKSKYGKVYDRMDMPTFFEMLEVYREQRHKAYIQKRDEDHAQLKGSGDSNRMSLDTEKESFREAMKGYMKESAKNNQ
jgi:hypothetical protein